VNPDGENNWYVNAYDGKIRYEDMFVQEFIPFIERGYRIRKSKEFRAIAGLSMGGHGSLIMALRHAELFAACAPLSAGVVTDEQYIELPQDNYDKMFGYLFGRGLAGQARISDHYKAYAPLHIISSQPADSTKRVRFYIDCGDDDWLSIGNAELHILMAKMEIPHEYRMRDGGHDWEYWRTGLIDALKFISEDFTR
jgi:S-formylglutathione hydrolase FrmB